MVGEKVRENYGNVEFVSQAEKINKASRGSYIEWCFITFLLVFKVFYTNLLNLL